MRLFHKTGLILLGLASANVLLAEPTKAIGNPVWNTVLNNIVLILGGAVILATLYTLWSLMTGLLQFHQRQLLQEQGIAPAAPTTPAVPLWKRLYNQAWKLIPIEREQEIDLGHNYDGIKELDNSLPPWWVYLFYATIIWGGAYFYVNHLAEDATSSAEAYEIAMEVAEEQKRAFLARQANAVDESNVVALMEAESIEQGHEIFTNNCANCHGTEGQGLVGPNLTDPYWLHGGDIKAVFKTIKYGVPAKGMIAWQTQLRPASIQKVASYILSLQGTQPANPKDPEGALYQAPEQQAKVLSEANSLDKE